jgi:hypothetical protein
MDTILALIKLKHADWDAAWKQLCALVEAEHEADPEALAAAMPAMLKGLKKWPKQGQHTPERWSMDAARFGALLQLGQQLLLIDAHAQQDEQGVAALLSAPMPRLRSLGVQAFRLTPARLKALRDNASLTMLELLYLHETGIKEDGLSCLLEADALWTSLHTLILAESGVTARCATLLANSPKLAGLKELGLSGSRIGPAGRAALSASPHLSDKAKRKAKLPVAARTTAEAPAPRDVFGDLRSLLQAAPSEHAWDVLCDMFGRLERSPERERVQQEFIPYAESCLATWPTTLRVAPMPWLREVMDGRDAPLGLQLARVLRLDTDVARVANARNLAKCAQLAQIERLDLSPCAASASALNHLLSGAFVPALRHLALRHDAPAAALDHSPELRLTSAALYAEQLILDAPSQDATLSQLTELELATQSTAVPQAKWVALLHAPWFNELERLTLMNIPPDELWAELRRADAPPPGLRALHITLPNSRDARAHAARWVARCPQLDALTLRLRSPMVEADERAWCALALPALRALTLKVESGTLDNAPRRLLAASWVRELEQLSLHNLDIVGFDLGDMVARFHAAQRLDLHSITSLMLGERFAQRLDETQVRHLTLSRCDANLSLMEPLSHSARWAHLRTLSFTHNRVDYEQRADMGWAARLPEGMEVLELQGDHSVQELLPDLLRSPAAATLRSLSLVRCGLDATSMAALAEALPSMKRLERLDLSGNHHLNERAIHHLLESQHLSQLSRLSLHYTYLGVRARTMLMTAPDIQLAAKAHMFAPPDLR